MMEKQLFLGDYSPGEWYSGYKGLISMRTATMVSANIPHVKALSTIGLSTGVKFLQSIGFTDVTGNEGLALALGRINKWRFDTADGCGLCNDRK